MLCNPFSFRPDKHNLRRTYAELSRTGAERTVAPQRCLALFGDAALSPRPRSMDDLYIPHASTSPGDKPTQPPPHAYHDTTPLRRTDWQSARRKEGRRRRWRNRLFRDHNVKSWVVFKDGSGSNWQRFLREKRGPDGGGGGVHSCARRLVVHENCFLSCWLLIGVSFSFMNVCSWTEGMSASLHICIDSSIILRTCLLSFLMRFVVINDDRSSDGTR